jgi:hypothetical protein
MGEVDINFYFPDYPTGRRKILYGILASARQFESENFQFGVSVLQGPGVATLGDRCPKFRESVVVSPWRVEMSKGIYYRHFVEQCLFLRLNTDKGRRNIWNNRRHTDTWYWVIPRCCACTGPLYFQSLLDHTMWTVIPEALTFLKS